jgi:3-dehydroquinate dehydratase-2
MNDGVKRILVINGPNLNLLGSRRRDMYGNLTLENINEGIMKFIEKTDIICEFFQSNVEGEIVSAIQQARNYFGIVINAGGYTHTSVAIRDACEIATDTTVIIEVHVSNITDRESFRHTSLLSPVCHGTIFGLLDSGYILAINAIILEQANIENFESNIPPGLEILT